LCPIMADSLTPEALGTALTKRGGHQFVHAGELSTFFGKQKYNTGLVERFLRLLDCPPEFTIETMARGEETIHEPTISMIGASTQSLMAGSSPTEILSGGFLNRFVIVVEKDTERCFPIPKKGMQNTINKLNEVISLFKGYSGTLSMSLEAEATHDSWYRQRWSDLRTTEDEATREVMARSYKHILKTSMLVHLAQCGTLTICNKCFMDSVNLMGFVEENLPGMVKTIKQSTISSESDYVLHHIIKSGGIIDHSTLLRKVANRMGAPQMKGYIATLRESGRVKEVKQGAARYYILQEDNNDSKK
jgi:hypothetical protein